MAKKDLIGFPLPFGLKSNNPMFDADEYAGPYDTVQDAFDTVEIPIREVGRMVGVYSDSSKKSVDIYRFEKDINDDWILVSKDGAIYTGKVNEIDIVGTEIGLSQTIKDDISGKMDKSTYDPTNVIGDAFDFTNMHSVPPFLEDAPEDGKIYGRKDAEWEEIEIGAQGQFTTDESLYLDPITNELRSNLTTTIDTFDYLSGVQEFTLTETPVRILYIWVQGVGLVKKNVQYEVDEVTKKLTILDELDGGEVITACYHNVINESITPFVTDVQVENKDLDVFKNESADPYVRFSEIPPSGVQTVTGDGVSGTPEDVVLTFPTPMDIGAIEDAPSDGKVYGRKDAAWEEIGQVGGGDMLASMYDPTNVMSDAFDYNNMYNTPDIEIVWGATEW